MNVCGLFRQSSGGNVTFSGSVFAGDRLHQHLGSASFVEDSFCSVAGISLRPERAAEAVECCIGDALTMIPPVTGNGMSMAFEAAELAIEPLTAYSHGEISWQRARETVAGGSDRLFRSRLGWARWLQAMMMLGPWLRPGPVSLALRCEKLWQTMFALTR